jgi:hypothetical protein
MVTVLPYWIIGSEFCSDLAIILYWTRILSYSFRQGLCIRRCMT